MRIERKSYSVRKLSKLSVIFYESIFLQLFSTCNEHRNKDWAQAPDEASKEIEVISLLCL